jgi:hypothetical protein
LHLKAMAKERTTRRIFYILNVFRIISPEGSTDVGHPHKAPSGASEV